MENQWEKILESYVYTMGNYEDEKGKIIVPLGTRCLVEKNEKSEMVLIPDSKKYEKINIPIDEIEIIDERYVDVIKDTRKAAKKTVNQKAMRGLLTKVLPEIKSTIEKLEKYKPTELKVVFEDYDNGVVFHELDMYDSTSIEDAIYDLLSSKLNIDDLQYSFTFITVNGANEVSEMNLSEIAY